MVVSNTSATAIGFTGYISGTITVANENPSGPCSLLMIVPAGLTYEIVATTGAPTINSWTEYR
jgi:hypothetical protein